MLGADKASKRKYFVLADVLVAVVVILAAVLGFVRLLNPSDSGELTAVVRVRGEVYTEICLSDVREPYELTIDGEVQVVLSVSAEGVRFESSECPDKLCVNSGELSLVGQSAVCLPARVSVELVADGSASADVPDAVVG